MDQRHETVLTVLREAGVQTNLDDTDTLADKILAALDREHAPAETHDDDGAGGHAATPDREHAPAETHDDDGAGGHAATP